MPAIVDLGIVCNQIGDVGAAAVAAAAGASGALTNLEKLYMSHNDIGDAGAEALATACARGALPRLDYVLWEGNAGELAPLEHSLKMGQIWGCRSMDGEWELMDKSAGLILLR